MLIAMRPADPRYAALPLPDGAAYDARLAYVVSLWGVLDPLGRYEMAEARGLKHYLEFHDAYFGTPETQAEASPLRILQRGERVELPPALLIQGTADEGVPQGMVAEVAERYQAAGGQAQLAWFEGMPHGIAGWPDPDVARMVERIKGFIAQQVAQTAVLR
jgi:acetyl esterase/lipase